MIVVYHEWESGRVMDGVSGLGDQRFETSPVLNGKKNEQGTAGELPENT